MVSLEQVEKLRERADVTFEEAKDALERSDGDMLDAIIYLERQGKTVSPPGGGRLGGAETADGGADGRADGKREGTHFFRNLGRLFAKLFNYGSTNYLDVTKNGEIVLTCPILVLVILLACFFWIIVPLMVVGLIFGFRYRFRGEELWREDVNGVMDKISDKTVQVVDGIKKSFDEK
jgi:hypothetical protein